MDKTNPHALQHILNGILVLVRDSEDMYITTNIRDPKEFIYIPHNAKHLLSFSISMKHDAEIEVPDAEGNIQLRPCYFMANASYKEKDFTWVGDEIGTWAFYSEL